MKIIKQLTVVMFYSALPLLIPFFYSLYLNDGAHVSIGLTIILLSFFAIPEVLMHIWKNAREFFDYLFNKEATWNYAEIIHFRNLSKEVETLTIGEILVLISIAWLIVPFIGAIPFFLHGMSPLDAVFESISGWTTTGLTVASNLETLPKSIILYRSITQWIGGLGVIVLALSVIRGQEALKFLKVEGRSYEVGIGKTIGLIFKIYLILTIIGAMFLYLSNMDLFNSVNLSMAGISTGGFFPFYSYAFTNLQKIILSGIMFVGAVSFLFFRDIGKLKLKKAFFEQEFLLYVFLTVLAIVLILLVGHEELSNTVFNAISSIASAGFSIADVNVMHNFAKYLLILLMLVGGMRGSTAGGIKVWRILIVLKSIARHIKSAFLPRGTVQVVKVNSSPVEESELMESSIFIFTYLLLFLFGSGIFLAFNYSLVNSLFLVSSALGTVGLSTLELYSVGVGAKVFLIILMYLGRIEIFPSLALIGFIGRLVKK